MAKQGRKKRETKPMTWIIDDEYDWEEEQDKDAGKVKIKGEKHPAVKDKYWTPDEADRVGEIRLRKHVDEDEAKRRTEEWEREHRQKARKAAGAEGTGGVATETADASAAGPAATAGATAPTAEPEATADDTQGAQDGAKGKGATSGEDDDKPPMFVVVKGRKGAKDTYYPVYDYDPKFHLFRRKTGWVRVNPVTDAVDAKALRREQYQQKAKAAAAGAPASGAAGADSRAAADTNASTASTAAATAAAGDADGAAETTASTRAAAGPVEGAPLPGFIKVTRVRVWPIILLFLIVLAVIVGITSLSTGVAPQDLPRYIGNQTGITHPSSKPTVSIEYATYESTPDTTWQAGTTEQQIHLVLPGGVSYTDSDGNYQSGENPVNAAPSVWVDVNGDGEFTTDECVYNCPTYDADGEITDPGSLLEPGNEVTTITINRTLEPGEYKARTLWTPRMRAGGDPANPMTFNWNLTVE